MSYKIFAPIYLISMILTYFVRILTFLLIGSSAVNPMRVAFDPFAVLMGALQEVGVLWFFASTIVLLSIYVLLCIISWMRGIANNYSSRLFFYPLVAGLFDIFIPVPFVPTVLLLCGFFIGTREYIED